MSSGRCRTAYCPPGCPPTFAKRSQGILNTSQQVVTGISTYKKGLNKVVLPPDCCVNCVNKRHSDRKDCPAKDNTCSCGIKGCSAMGTAGGSTGPRTRAPTSCMFSSSPCWRSKMKKTQSVGIADTGALVLCSGTSLMRQLGLEEKNLCKTDTVIRAANGPSWRCSASSPSPCRWLGVRPRRASRLGRNYSWQSSLEPLQRVTPSPTGSPYTGKSKSRRASKGASLRSCRPTPQPSGATLGGNLQTRVNQATQAC